MSTSLNSAILIEYSFSTHSVVFEKERTHSQIIKPYVKITGQI